MVEARERFVLLGGRHGDVEIEEIKGRLNVRECAHEGWRSLWLDYRLIFIILAVI